MSFIKKSLDHRQVILTLTALIFVAGISALLTMPRREDPKFNIRQGLVVVAYPGATAKQVQDEVIDRVEKVLFGYEEVRKDKTYSNSREGVGYVVVELESFVTDADLFWSKLQHRFDLLKLTEMPLSVIGPVVESDFGDTIALLISFQSENRDSRELQSYVDQLGDRLRGIRSLSKIKNIGTQQEAYYIDLDNQKLSQYNIYLPQVILALRGENKIQSSGSVEVDGLQVTFINKNQYTSKADIEDQVVGISGDGDLVKVGDIATVTRKQKEPEQHIRVNGVSSILMSLEMQNGFNIVDFGEEVQEVIADFKAEIPQDVEIIQVVNQPENVAESVNDFIREFFIAIIAVVIVILLLLPFRVALIAAAAIPVTVAFTFTLMDGLGIQLQQVSLASLIVVLGMLVDDAIVIADNYVEKLDEGLDNYTAAWQSADQLKVPMFTAGLTIVGAFAPLIFLTGYVGEFIESLPFTVAIAINASFIVAMFLTPYLCYKFIKVGLAKGKEEKKRKSFLDYLEKGFDRALDFGFGRPKLIFGFAILVVIAGGLMFIPLKQKLFPAAERDQFVVEMRAKEGTSLDKMNQLTRRVESEIAQDPRVKNYATFVGTSAPRFYYNYAQHFPQTNTSQILINTLGIEETEEMVRDLEVDLNSHHPEMDVIVKKMQQGPSLEAPIELRLSGPDTRTLEKLGDSLVFILRNSPEASHVVSDFFEKKLSVEINTDQAAANRLGITDGALSTELTLAYDGIEIGQVWEAKTPVEVILKDMEAQNRSMEELQNFYITSPLTGASVPLGEIANISPSWVSTNLRRRNGVNTLTVQSQAGSQILPSEILASVQDTLDDFVLPAGYSLTIGGEYENQNETFAEMNKVMVFSVFVIFIIMLIQFKRLNHVFIVLAAIPLSIFGASLGLLLTGYPFGFTAFVGLASLIGVSVRNSIILVDYANELVIKENKSVKEAAIHAGKRRIRPIFLTTMAAAIGVTPMILSGSPLWAPLAAVLAVGLVFSMVMCLLVIPVLYWKFGEVKMNPATLAPVILFGLFFFPKEVAAQSLPLEEAMTIAKDANPQLKLLELEIQKKQLEKEQVKTNYLPKVMLDGGYFWYYNSARTTDVEISITDLPLIGGVPPIGLGTEFLIPEESRFMGVANLGIYQPITQFFKISSGVSIKDKELLILENQRGEALAEVRKGIAKLYAGIAIEDIKISSLDSQIVLVKEQLRQADSGILEGQLLELYSVGLQADLMDHQTKLAQAKIERRKYGLELNKLLDFPADSSWSTQDFEINAAEVQEILTLAGADSAQYASPKLQKAILDTEMADAGVSFYKNELIPDVTFIAEGFYFENVPIVPRNNIFVGAALSWPILQWGKKRKDISISTVQLRQAEIQRDLIRKEVGIELQTKVLELENALDLFKTAEQGFKFRSEELRIKQDAFSNGLISYQDYAEVQKKQLESLILLTEAKANILVQQFELEALLSL
ncbi:efflux RND transporter permease subunit [Algoriphagus namhaensis]